MPEKLTTGDDRTLALDLAETLLTEVETADLEIGAVTFSHRSVELMAEALRKLREFAASSAPADKPTTDLPAELRHRANAHLGDLCHGDAVCMQSAATEIERLRRIEAAAIVQWEAFGAYPGLVEALK